MGRKSSKLFVGMDVHKDSIDVALAEEAGEVRHYGRISGDMHALACVVRKLESLGRSLVFVYEAGPCGFGIYRMLRARGHECWVVAPSNTPRRVRDRIKTDRRDSVKLAGLARAGELTPIHVPDAVDEAMRDLVRAREDAVAMQRQVRHRLAALLLRNDIRYAGKTAWTEAHRRWIARLSLPSTPQRIAFEEYVAAVREATERVARLTRAMEQELAQWRWQPVVRALQACRGIQLIHAVRIVAELGELSRFSHPRELMAYLGLIPSENSSGDRRFQGSITKAGNGSARRALIEAAWAYQHAPAVSPVIARRQTGLPKAAIAIAWQAQLRLCARFRRLSARGLNRNKVVVAIARELAGFVWAIGQQVKPAAGSSKL
jgi:transposase